MSPKSHLEEGSSTVMTVGIIAFTLALSVTICAFLGAVTAKARIQTGADLAALAGAQISATALLSPANSAIPASFSAGACQLAKEAATRNNVSLENCEVVGANTIVTTGGTTKIFGISIKLEAKAKAGPEAPYGQP